MPRSDTREKLMTAGLKLLHRRGFNGCGVQEVTDLAGVPKGSFYNYFASKEALGLEVLERYWQGLRLFLKPLQDDRTPAVERLRGHFAAMCEATERWDYERGCLIGNFSAEMANQSPQVRDRLAVILAEWTRSLAPCVAEAQQAGSLSADLDPNAIAEFLINAFQGAILRTKVDKNSRAFEAFHNVVFAAIFAA